ncbi:ThuA domain-containing protein [Dactylosporangium sp. NPDC005572]|uniref:ThuA domain-containing protein n=1 Tax=Dactylosporangium sp. NPDC005572 TaxID=3156889 RepID=UPI00339E55CF
MFRRVLLCVAVVLAATGINAVPAYAADFSVLVFSKTAGFRHDSIPAGIAAIQQLGTQNNFTVEATEDAGQFTATNLARFRAVIWLSTTGDVLDAAQQTAFENYVRGGGGYVGLHAAADTEYDWAWYGNLVGAYFASHPAIQPVRVRVEDTVHPSTAGLPATWNRTDELYNYRTNPRPNVHVLANLDETSYTGGSMGTDHPISWCRAYDGGRSWYTGLGHTIESFSEANFRTHLLGGIRYAAQGTGSCTVGTNPPAGGTFSQVNLAKGVAEVGEPMGLTVLPNRGVLHTSRDGVIRYTDVNGNTKVAMTLAVYSHDEEGLQSIKADPNFATNKWVYVYYAPPLSTPGGDAPANGTAAQFAPFNGSNRLARFTVRDDYTIDPNSGVTVLDVPTSRGTCCHVGGDIDFDAQGNLYLSTGDDTNPFESGGYAPLDERADRNPAYDAQRTSGNSNDLRGKVLRIKPGATGGYTVPAGNMFAPGTARTRPEIYAMGFRNPFRMSVDKATGVVYLGDYGPDAGTADPNRGPAGTVSFERIAQPGFYGWPYCSNYNTPYNDYTFPSGPSNGLYNCAGGPTNNSPNNTGITALPASQAAWLPYGGAGPSRPELGGGGPMGGPVYNFNAALVSDVKFPASYNGKVFLGEFTSRWIKTVTLNGNGTAGAIEPIPWSGTAIMDMEFGPDGALYVLDYGTTWFGGDANSALYRIEYNSGANRAPIAQIGATPSTGAAPLTVQFSSAGSNDPDGDPITYAWDFTTDGTTDSTAANPTFTYPANGEYIATLTVRDNGGRISTASTVIGVGRPSITLVTPADGSVFQFGDLVPFQVQVTDPNAGTIDCNRVVVNYVLGHDSHGHPITSKNGCSGSIQTTVDGEHDANANIFGVLAAVYTPVSGTAVQDQHVLQPRTRQAEHYGTMNGVQLAAKASAHGGNAVGYVENGDWISFTPYNLAGVTGFKARVASAGLGGTLTVRVDSPTGPAVSTVQVAPTGGWETWVDVNGTVNPPAGTHQLYLVFTGGTGGSLFDIDDFTFTSGTTPPPPTSTNLALNKPATASSTEAGAYPATAAVDGSLTTRWASAFADPQWIQVDLGQSYAIDRVKLTWEGAYGSAYQIQTSANGTTWTTVKTVTGADGGVDEHTGLGATGRYVRINGTTRATAWGYSLWEFEVYGGSTPPPPTSTNLALNKPATASSTEAGAYPATAAVDGSLTTRWASAFADPQWIRVDLGQSYSINRVKLTWEAAYGSAYQIQVSADGTNWTTVKTVTGADGGVDEHTGLAATGRYVRINGTTRATAWGYSLFEFEVYS